jgi:sugar transferase EpsL
MARFRHHVNVLLSRVRRAMDVVGAAAGLFVLAPFLLLIALAVRCFLGSPVLFRQVRPDLYGRPFELLKFRTMTDAAGANGALRPDAERLTRFGEWLRRTSLDELPEPINVLRGEMSLVGPRPLVVDYLGHYSTGQARRHEVCPGITGGSRARPQCDQLGAAPRARRLVRRHWSLGSTSRSPC